MNAALKNNIAKFWQQGAFSHLSGIKRGFEKESLRVNHNGELARTPHPKELGASLTHPMITTDYSEALLEFVTPPTTNLNSLFKDLLELHQYAYRCLDKEFLWLASMPCMLPKDDEIPIAEYGSSNIGQVKHIYRKGLGLRYGRSMQTIAGIHYNFSFPMEFWQALEGRVSAQTISEQYLGLLRNGLRYGFMIPFLFGASPAVCRSFLGGKSFDFLQSLGTTKGESLERAHSFIGPQATSLRLSDIGYQNKKQAIRSISYNSMAEFLESVRAAVHTINPEFERYGVKVGNEWNQLSACYLQIEDEHYAALRPKRVSGIGERMLPALQEKGIEYIELRTLDINPFNSVGIEQETIYFLDVFLLMCLLLPSPKITPEEDGILRQNFSKVIHWGRQPGLALINQDREIKLLDWMNYLFDDMEMVALKMDQALGVDFHVAAIERIRERLHDSEELPSARVASEILDKNQSYLDFVARISRRHEEEFKSEPMAIQRAQFFAEMARESEEAKLAIEATDRSSLDEFLQDFLRP